MESQCAPDAAISADCVGLLLPGFIPRSGLPHVIFLFEHECTRGTDPNAVSAVNARGVRQRNVALRRDMRLKSTTGDGNGECVLSIASASFDALVTKNAFGVIANVQIIVDLHGSMHVGGSTSVPV